MNKLLFRGVVLLLAVSIAWGVCIVLAQPLKAQKAGQIPALPPDPSHWTVQMKWEGTEPSGPSVEVSREVWSIRKEGYEVITWSDGKVSHLLVSGQIGFSKPSSASADVYILDAEAGSIAPPSLTSWPEFSWIRPELLKGEASYAGKSCILYETKDGDEVRRAYVDRDTLLPVALIQGRRTCLYEFKAPPTSLPAAEPAITQMRARYEATKRKLTTGQAPR